jgi:hypothetical protein
MIGPSLLFMVQMIGPNLLFMVHLSFYYLELGLKFIYLYLKLIFYKFLNNFNILMLRINFFKILF